MRGSGSRSRKMILARREAVRICGAKAKSTGKPCKLAPANKEYPFKGNGRCGWHGGLSTGPKTVAGRSKSLANLKQYRSVALTNPEQQMKHHSIIQDTEQETDEEKLAYLSTTPTPES